MTPTELAAQTLALWAHAGQRYGDPPDDVPYISHCADVVAVLRKHGIDDPAVLAAAWLHDALEDADLDPARIGRQCGPRALALVRAVTDAPGTTRAKRKAATLPRVRAAGRDAVAVKLADRIANVRASSGDSRARMYFSEQSNFRRALHRREDGLGPMWRSLRAALRDAMPSPRLSPEAWADRWPPLPPHELVGALHDPIHVDPGRGRVAKAVRAPKRGRMGEE